MAMKGKSALCKVSSDGAAWTTIGSMNVMAMDSSGNNIDVSVFGNDYVAREQALKDATYSVSGFYDSTDTNGQVAIRAAWAADTDLYVGFLPDGAAGWEQPVKVSTYNISANVDGVVEVSMEFEGAGAIATYS